MFTWNSIQDAAFDFSLEHDATSLCLRLEIPKDTEEDLIASVLRMASRAFAETEGTSVDSMHAELERQVRGFESDSHFRFVWDRSFEGNDPLYPQRLRGNLATLSTLRAIN
jgi:hypothetical protein